MQRFATTRVRLQRSAPVRAKVHVRFLMIATLYSPDCAGILSLGGSWLGARGCGSSDRVFSGRSCQVEFSLQSRLLRSCQTLSPQPATRVRRGVPASVRTLLASRRRFDDQWLAGRSLTRPSSCAFAAAMMVDALIEIGRASCRGRV